MWACGERERGKEHVESVVGSRNFLFVWFPIQLDRLQKNKNNKNKKVKDLSAHRIDQIRPGLIRSDQI